ncbi:MAG: TadE/TadG family type IV pilus assembly protein, partial [Pseudomonadota bacterium]
MRIVHCVLARRAMRFRRADDGVAAVEFGLLLLPFLLMLMAIMELAMLMTTNSTVESALAMASREIKT